MRDNDPCRTYEPTLAALDELEELALDPDAVDAARAHLAGCPRCQARRRMWARLDGALRDALAPTAAPPALTTAGLLAAIGADHEPSERRTPMLSVIYVRDEDIMDDDSFTTSSIEGSEAPARNFAPLPSLKPARQPAWRRALTGFIAIAAVAALIASITGALALTGHLRSAHTTSNTASATQTAQAAAPTFPPDYQIVALSMDSPTDGWAIMCNEISNLNSAYVLHIANGAVIQQATLNTFTGSQITLQALSPTDVWVLFAQPGHAFYHYDGQTWAQVSLPVPAGAEGNSVSPEAFHMLSPTEGWAIASYSPSATATSATPVFNQVFYRYDGSAWRMELAEKAATAGRVADPSLNMTYAIQITGMSAAPGGDVWATGYVQVQDASGNPIITAGYVYHRVGGVWRLAQTLPDDALYGIAMTGAHSGWIIGQSVKVVQAGGNVAPYKVTQTKPIVLGWNGARWAPAAIPQPDQTQAEMSLSQIAASSPSNVWVVGGGGYSVSFTPGDPYVSDNSYLIHYDGSRWSTVSLPQVAAVNPSSTMSSVNLVSFDMIALTSSGDPWIAGALVVNQTRPNYQIQPLLYRSSGGQWTNVALPAVKSTGDGNQPAG